MRYIRTENGIYEVIKEILDGEAYEVKVPQSKWEYDEDNSCYYEYSKLDAFYKKDILKQSDNLAELCDEFVIDDKRNKVRYLMDYEDVIEELYDGRIYEHDFVYGAIWCEWGLKYVVKVDNKGGLELI